MWRTVGAKGAHLAAAVVAGVVAVLAVTTRSRSSRKRMLKRGDIMKKANQKAVNEMFGTEV